MEHLGHLRRPLRERLPLRELGCHQSKEIEGMWTLVRCESLQIRLGCRWNDELPNALPLAFLLLALGSVMVLVCQLQEQLEFRQEQVSLLG